MRLLIPLLLYLSVQNSVASDNARYSEALSKAKDAALIQTGVQAQINYAKDISSSYALSQAVNLGIDKPLGAVLFSYKVYRDKSLIIKTSKTTALTLGAGQVSFSLFF